MINTEQLRELQAEFESTRLAEQSSYKELEKLRRTFERRFPRNKLLQLKLSDYVQGKGSKESFCYWVEWELSDLGHIQGAPVKKFGVFFSKKKDSFQYTKEFQRRENPFGVILSEIASLLDAAEKNDKERIRSAKVSPMFKGKLLFLYFPTKFINIYSERLIDHFLRHLRLNEPGADLDLISKRELLVKFKNNDAVMKDWSMFEFHDFLHWAWQPPARKAEVSHVLKDYILDFPSPEDTTPAFISLEFDDANNSHREGIGAKPGAIDFEQKSRRAKLIGSQGEDIVFLAEKRELRENGRPDLAQKVKPTYKTDDGAGYDISSFELDGTPKQIEVKSTTSHPPIAKSSFRFFLSANEYEHAKALANFYLYIVFDVKSKMPNIFRIKNPASLVPRYLVLKPSKYLATITVI